MSNACQMIVYFFCYLSIERPVREYYENPTIQEDTNSSFDEISLEIQTEHTDTSEELYDRFILGTSQQLDTNFIDEKNCETNDSSDEEYCEVTSIEKRSSPGNDSKTEDQCGPSRYVNFPDKQTKGNGRCFSAVGLECGETSNPQCQHYQELDDDKSLLKFKRKPQRDLIDVPDYELFSEEGKNVDTEDTSLPEVPNYENGAAGLSNISIARPFPFKTKHQTGGPVTPRSSHFLY